MADLEEKTIETKDILPSLRKERSKSIDILKFVGFQKIADEDLKEILIDNDGIAEIVKIYKELKEKGFEIGWREKFIEFCEKKA